MTSIRTVIALLAFVGAGVALAEDARAAGYATDDKGNLYRVFPGPKEVEKIGVVSVPAADGGKPDVPSLTDIALHDDKGMYGISYTHLYKIDVREPHKSTRVGSLGGNFFSTFNALEFDADGTLYLAGSSTLYRVDLASGKATPIGGFGTTWTSDGDLAWIGDTLYLTVSGPKGCLLTTVDVKTGKATRVGRIQTAEKKGFAHVWGLIWDGRVLHALTPDGEVLELDRKTAVAEVRFRVGVLFWGACSMLRI